MKDILIIKVGTSTLTILDKHNNRTIDNDSFKRLGDQIHRLSNEGYGIIIVSSAAIAAGMANIGLTKRPDKCSQMPELQRLASIGWSHILNSWSKSLKNHVIDELLLTNRELLEDTREVFELMRTIQTMLRYKDIIIANENDAISHSEISFGDNDTLAAHLAAAISRSGLINATIKLLLLSDINGVYRNANEPNSIINKIYDTRQLEDIAHNTASQLGTGGMTTKFIAANVAAMANVDTWIGNGKSEDVIKRMLAYQHGTSFKLSFKNNRNLHDCIEKI
jgi:glutamate 5-kinase